MFLLLNTTELEGYVSIVSLKKIPDGNDDYRK